MPLEPDIFVNRAFLALVRSEDREVVMAYCLKWKTQPSATRICWVTTGAHCRRLSMIHLDHPA